MDPSQEEIGVKDEKAATAATGSASAEGSIGEDAPADAKPASSGGEKGPSEPGSTSDGGLSSNDAAKGQENSSDAAGLWMYADGVNPTQHGPLAESAVLKLLRIGTAHKDMMAWSQGMSEWKPLGQVSLMLSLAVVDFRASCLLLAVQAHQRADNERCAVTCGSPGVCSAVFRRDSTLLPQAAPNSRPTAHADDATVRVRLTMRGRDHCNKLLLGVFGYFLSCVALESVRSSRISRHHPRHSCSSGGERSTHTPLQPLYMRHATLPRNDTNGTAICRYNSSLSQYVR